MADEIDDATLDAGRRANIDARDGEVDRALASSNFAMAVHKALENPPLGTKDQEVKVRTRDVQRRGRSMRAPPIWSLQNESLGVGWAAPNPPAPAGHFEGRDFVELSFKVL